MTPPGVVAFSVATVVPFEPVPRSHNPQAAPPANSTEKGIPMATDKQREANRLNALHSTGPRTPEGLAKSAQNSFKHGLCVDDSTLFEDPETKADIAQHLARYFDYYQPQSPLEQDALEEIAICKIRLRHLQRAQMGLINDAREKMFDKHTFTDPDGRHWHFYDSAAHPPGDERFVANRLLGIACSRSLPTSTKCPATKPASTPATKRP
jgi:hypothetical protein